MSFRKLEKSFGCTTSLILLLILHAIYQCASTFFIYSVKVKRALLELVGELSANRNTIPSKIKSNRTIDIVFTHMGIRGKTRRYSQVKKFVNHKSRRNGEKARAKSGRKLVT